MIVRIATLGIQIAFQVTVRRYRSNVLGLTNIILKPAEGPGLNIRITLDRHLIDPIGSLRYGRRCIRLLRHLDARGGRVHIEVVLVSARSIPTIGRYPQDISAAPTFGHGKRHLRLKATRIIVRRQGIALGIEQGQRCIEIGTEGVEGVGLTRFQRYGVVVGIAAFGIQIAHQVAIRSHRCNVLGLTNIVLESAEGPRFDVCITLDRHLIDLIDIVATPCRSSRAADSSIQFIQI